MTKTRNPITCRPHVRPVAARAELSALAQTLAAKNAPAVLGGNPSVRGVSVFAAEPVETLELALSDNDPFGKLNAFLSRYQLASDATLPPFFCGGWIGYFGYELGRFIEKLPHRAADDIGLPMVQLAFYDKAIVYDPAQDAFHLVAVEMDAAASIASKFATLNDWLNEAAACSTNIPAEQTFETVEPSGVECNLSPEEYFAALKQIGRHIVDGDVYQINFSQRFSTPFRASAIDLFHWQNRHNPSPYAAYLGRHDAAVVSASPELFLQVSGDRIVTCPIKGTRPRKADLPESAAENRARFAELVESEKDQAELAMIVDLERNDLARVCVAGTREVLCARTIEAFPTVYHAAATVAGTLALPATPERIEGVLRATFPGGSITGAPKIRAMEIIDALEPTARGVYTGSIGWIGLNFDLCWNIAIRTVVVHRGCAYVQTGGGIVADSDPQAEWDETLVKARALLDGIRSLNAASAIR